jgi:NADH:ubiquinone oxidoreductase subunit K
VIGIQHYLVVSAILFVMGVLGIFATARTSSSS